MSFPDRKELYVHILESYKLFGGKAHNDDLFAAMTSRFPQLTREDLAMRTPKGDRAWHWLIRIARQDLANESPRQVQECGNNVWRLTDVASSRLDVAGWKNVEETLELFGVFLGTQFALSRGTESHAVYEGTQRLVTHVRHERKVEIVRSKKATVLEATGKLECEACSFDFAAAYGEAGQGLIDCHHRKPVASLQPGEPTTLEDLALVCCYCHRVIHSLAEPLSVEAVRDMFAKFRAV